MNRLARPVVAAMLAVSLGLAQAPRAHAETTVEGVLARLVTMDADLTECWRTRAAAAIIVAKLLRACIADRREDERRLKEELNKQIGTLGTDDPLRREYIDAREMLAYLTAFMNALDAGAKTLPEEAAPEDVEPVVIEVCEAIEIDQDRIASFQSRGARLPGLCIKPDVGAPGVSVRASYAGGDDPEHRDGGGEPEEGEER